MPSSAEGVHINVASWENRLAICTSCGFTLPILGAHATKKCARWYTKSFLQCYSMATNGDNSNVQVIFYFEKLGHIRIMECYATLKNNRLLFYSTTEESHRYVIG